MRLRISILSLFILISLPLWAQFEERNLSARSLGLGSVNATLTDSWSAISNQSALALQKEFSAGVAVSNQFLLHELSNKGIACILPFPKIGTFSAAYTHFGNQWYSEQFAGIAYARNFGSKFSAGLQFDYLWAHFQTPDLDNQNMFTLEMGVQYLIIPSLRLGFHLFNPFSVKRSDYENERIPAVFQLGLAYNLVKDLTAFLEVEKNILTQYRLKLALEYRIVSIISARLGFASQPTIYSLGTGLNFKKWNFDLGFQLHQQLGFCPAISGMFRF